MVLHCLKESMSTMYLIMLMLLVDEVIDGQPLTDDQAEGNGDVQVTHLHGHKYVRRINLRSSSGQSEGHSEGLVANLQGPKDGLGVSIEGMLGLSKAHTEGLVASIQGLLEKATKFATLGPATEEPKPKIVPTFSDELPKVTRVVIPEEMDPDGEQRIISRLASLNTKPPDALLTFITHRSKYNVLNLPPYYLLPF
ncbi:unnamed protein product [Meganyctiphanes norvegica]|uniref:Uncharacterized protein n=1 Tax=Meganyctiphanes norvegica TaxID=48144 RepID=A0AAV2QX33_MEGNR